MKRLIVVGSIITLLFFSTYFEGEPLSGSGMELRLFRPAVDSKGHITVNGTSVLPHLGISFGLILDYGYSEMRMFDNPIVDHIVFGTFHFNLGLGNFSVVGVQIPIGVSKGSKLNNSENFEGIDLSKEWSSQFIGDIILHGKFRFLRVERNPIGLGGVIQLQFGTGKETGFIGDPGPFSAVTMSVIVDTQPTRWFRASLNLGYKLVIGDGAQITYKNKTFKYDDQILFGIGTSFNLIKDRLDFVIETFGNTVISHPFAYSTGHLPLEVDAGIKVYLEKRSYLYFGGGTGIFSPGYSSPKARAFAAWVFEPSIGDRDGDGIKDDIDKCPDDPEDLDEFEDLDGCPDPDNDRDGILDTEDECPTVPEDRDGDADEDGCPEGEASDRDGDGILDSEDQCPDDPEDIDQFEDEDGCPDKDNDKDGILDQEDLCPNDPEDKDQFEDQDGCPDKDNDKDRILDEDDACPNDPEVYNGYKDEDGCPDEGRVKIKGSDIVILDKIYFETDSAVIKPISYPILDAVAATIKGNPQITLIEIQGHTDERASDEYNLKLSQERAQAVLEYLVSKGVEREKLRAVGYGELCPVDPAHTEEAWAKNRRVEFKIVRTVAGPTGVQLACPAGEHLVPKE